MYEKETLILVNFKRLNEFLQAKNLEREAHVPFATARREELPVQPSAEENSDSLRSFLLVERSHMVILRTALVWFHAGKCIDCLLYTSRCV